MSASGISEFLRLYAVARSDIPWLPAIVVTDDLPADATTPLGAQASAQVSGDGMAVRLRSDLVPGEALVFHETGHVLQALVRARLIGQHGGQVGELLWDSRQHEVLAARALTTTGNEAEGFAALVAEAFLGQLGGYYAGSVPDAQEKLAAWYASPASADTRAAILALNAWTPTSAEIDAATPRPTVPVIPSEPQPAPAASSLSAWSTGVGHDIARALATLLGIPVPEKAWFAFAVQAQRECAGGTSVGAQNNNPLNLTTGNGRITWPGQTGTYGGGDATEWHGDFASFGSLEAGVWACAANYTTSPYDSVQDAFRGGDPVAIAEAIEASPWDSGHYAGTLADEVRAELGITKEDLPVTVTRDFYAEQIEPFVKETKRLLDKAELQPAIEAELEERLRGIQGVDIAGLADAVTKRVEADIAAKLTT